MNLETVEEHNERVNRLRRDRTEAARRTGVACPDCGNELEWSVHVSNIALAFSGDRPARCPVCKREVRLEWDS